MKLHACALIISLFGSLVWAEDGPAKTFSIVLDKPDSEYTIEVGGTDRPENIEIVIENLGDTAVVNPRLSVNGLYDWYDVNSLAAEITRGAKTDEEKAMAVWSWVLYKRFQRSPADHSALHPIRGLSGYGYGNCGFTAAWLKGLLTAAGVKARVQELWGHTVNEAFWDGAWHLLDGNAKAFYLDRDNRTIASLGAVERDGGLILRTIHPADPWFRGADPPGETEEWARYFISYKDNYEEHGYDSEIAKEYTMAMTLRPGEKLIRWWGPELGRFESQDRGGEVPKRYANGRLIWEPDLRRIDMQPYLSVPSGGNIATRGQDGRSPAIHVADLQNRLYTHPSTFAIPIASPYPVLGGRFSCMLVKEGSSDLATISLDRPGLESGDLYTFRWDKGSKTVEVDLGSKIMRKGAVYGYEIAFALRGDAESTPPTQSGVDAFRSVTDLQVAPESLPALALGKNTIRFWHHSPGAGKVRITHRWREDHGLRPPARVDTAVTPADGGEAGRLTPILKWRPAPAEGKVVDYQVMVSLRPDCRWPLSQTLFQNVGSEKTEWTVPAGFLNPGTTYYWHVRARGGEGKIGEWGPVFRFTTAGSAR